ncbi:MAG TPA: TonB-dependent receptor [Pyrinomonadaceae bacterium]|nr:TonB-dependent receptor [Pyrinomonadaceae bacterium]
MALLKTTALVLVVLVASGSVLLGQTSTGEVNGTITDSQGAVIPGVTVRLINKGTNIENQVTTNRDGYFTFVNVKPGPYMLKVEKAGFAGLQVGHFDVGVAQVVSQNFNLEIGEITQTIEIQSGAELLQSSSTELGNVISEKVVQELPLNGRNFTQLLILTPGVNPVSTAQGSQREINFGAAEGNTGIPGSTLANASIQGQQNRSKIYFLDGIINTSVRGTSYVVLPDIDSIQEFKVQSHNAKAEYGGVTGGVVNMTTKSGTNAFRGSAFAFVRNEIFDARDPFRDANRNDPPTFRQNQFGANIGGPIFKNRTFFYASYDGWRYRDVANIQMRVPTERELNGDFSQSIFNRQIFNPFTTRIVNGTLVRDPFPNNIIPQELISPRMQGFFKAYSIKPNLVGDPSFNFRQERARANDANAFQIRGDHNFSANDNIFFRWNEQRIKTFNPIGDRGARTPEATNRNFGGGWVHSFSPSVIFEVRGGVATQPTEDAPFEHELGSEPLEQLGFPQLDRFEGVATVLSSNPWNLGTLGVQGARPRGNPNWNLSTDLTWLRGNHNFKTGFQFIHIRRDQRNRFMQVNFDAQPTRNPQVPSGTGDDLASALLGLPSRIQGFVHEFGSIDFGIGTWSTYFQDSWSLRPNLTLTYGLRYDYVGKVKGNGLQSGPDLKTGEWLIALPELPPVCSGGAPPCLPAPLNQIPFNSFIRVTGEEFSILKPIKDNWGPRVGLAWQINNKLVLRTGYGLVWDALPSRSQYGQHQFESWGWPQFSGIDTGTINREGDPIESFETLANNLPFALPRAAPWNSSGWYNDPDRKDGYSHQWHAEIQRQMTSSLMMSVAYVGSKSGRLEYAGVAQAAVRPGIEAGTGRRLTPAEVNQLRPWPHITGNFRYEDDIGYSNYHSLQYKMQRRLSQGVSTLLSYTWSKCIDTSSGWFNAENGIGGNATVQNYHDIDSNRGVCGYDIPHLLTWGTVFELPFGKGKRWLQSGPAAAILGNWQANWLAIGRSGQPFTIEVGGDPANIGAGQIYSRANVISDPFQAGPVAAHPDVRCRTTISQGGLAADQVRTPRTWYNPCAFATPVNSFGNAGRNILRTDNWWNVDFSLFRNIRMGERWQVQLRAEAFNVFNHIDLGNPSTRLDQATPGRVTTASHGPRQLQFGLRLLF